MAAGSKKRSAARDTGVLGSLPATRPARLGRRRSADDGEAAGAAEKPAAPKKRAAERTAGAKKPTAKSTGAKAAPAAGKTSRPKAAPAAGKTSRPKAAPAAGKTSRAKAAPAGGKTSRPKAAPAAGKTSRPKAAPAGGKTSRATPTPRKATRRVTEPAAARSASRDAPKPPAAEKLAPAARAREGAAGSGRRTAARRPEQVRERGGPRPVRSGSPGLDAVPVEERPTTQPPSGAELVTTVVKAAGEVAQIGITVGGQILKRAVDRLPRP